MAEYLVVGLGNIGAEYARTRHNMGFMILDAWAQASNVVFSVERYGAVAEVSFKGRHFTLLKPSTYMNLSGNAVRYWLQRLNLPLENLIVICDDLNLPFGTTRMRQRGSDGGHNGLENIIWTLESEDWTRIRVGIGKKPPRMDLADYVLGHFSKEEETAEKEAYEKVSDAILMLMDGQIEEAMNQYNRKVALTEEPSKEE